MATQIFGKQAVDIEFTPVGTIAGADVQTALAEAATEAIPASYLVSGFPGIFIGAGEDYCDISEG